MFEVENKEIIDGCEVCCFEISAPKKKCYNNKISAKKFLILMLLPFAYALDFLSLAIRALATVLIKAVKNFVKLPLQIKIKKLASVAYTLTIAGTSTYLFYGIINYLA